MADKEFVKVGAAVFVLNSRGETLFFQRHGSHGAGSWCIPGGHVDPGETPAQAARREAFEEAGVRVGKMKFVGVTSDDHTKNKKPERKFYVTFYFTATMTGGKARIREPHKSAQMQWVKLNQLPTPLFLPIVNLMKGEKSGVVFGADKSFVRKLKTRK